MWFTEYCVKMPENKVRFARAEQLLNFMCKILRYTYCDST